MLPPEGEKARACCPSARFLSDADAGVWTETAERFASEQQTAAEITIHRSELPMRCSEPLADCQCCHAAGRRRKARRAARLRDFRVMQTQLFGLRQPSASP